jgi:hypothetical protein
MCVRPPLRATTAEWAAVCHIRRGFASALEEQAACDGEALLALMAGSRSAVTYALDQCARAVMLGDFGVAQNPDHSSSGDARRPGSAARPSQSLLPMLARAYGSKVPSGPAGTGSVIEDEPGTLRPGTPFTDCVENANVSAANAIKSLLTSSAWLLLFANVSQARW